MGKKLNADEKTEMANKIKEFLSDECDVPLEEITDDTDIAEDLKADSLVFLELIQEIQADYDLDIELRQIGKYIVKHPVKTVGEAVETLYMFVERGEEMLVEMKKEEGAS